MMINFQARLDYESLTAICIKHKKSDLFFKFLESSSLRRKFRKAAIVAGFRESVKRDELAIATQIWHKHTEIIQHKVDEITEIVV